MYESDFSFSRDKTPDTNSLKARFTAAHGVRGFSTWSAGPEVEPVEPEALHYHLTDTDRLSQHFLNERN